MDDLDTPKKLSLTKLPTKKPRPQPLEMQTPPLHTLASVPFQWEEAPGKPRITTTTTSSGPNTTPPSKTKIARCLDLPPRLTSSGDAKVTNMPSPTTVLGGPDMSQTQSLSRASSFSFPNVSFRSADDGFLFKSGKGQIANGRLSLGSWRWGGYGFAGNRMGSSTTIDFPDPLDCVGGQEGGIAVKITRIRRRSSFLKLSRASSSLWAGIYGGFKQAVPWRRKQVKVGRIV